MRPSVDSPHGTGTGTTLRCMVHNQKGEVMGKVIKTVEVAVGRKKRNNRMLGISWAAPRKSAFYTLTEQLKEDTASGFARRILEAYMLAVFGPDRSRELGILGEHEKWERACDVDLLEYAIEKYAANLHGPRASTARNVSDEMRREDAINNSGKRHKENLTKVS